MTYIVILWIVLGSSTLHLLLSRHGAIEEVYTPLELIFIVAWDILEEEEAQAFHHLNNLGRKFGAFRLAVVDHWQVCHTCCSHKDSTCCKLRALQ